MAPADSFSPAGSSTYSSETLFVGDGTWVASKNSFLLPNLVGLNFETMRYNGMGNRFASLTQYHQIILGHGLLACITFLFLVPAAILISQFYTRSPFWALRLHIYLQILTTLLSTVVFTLGWFAVGPSRSFTNPHHGIGMAIYVLVLVQGIMGSGIHLYFKKRIPRRLPLSLMLHQWIGKATALLGFAQVALGLTLYGSPKVLFVLYALWMAFLLVLTFTLHYRTRPVLLGGDTDIEHESTHAQNLRSNMHGGLLSAHTSDAGASTFLESSRDRIRNRSHSRNRREKITPSKRDSHTESHTSSESFMMNEKQSNRQDDSFGKKILKIAAFAGLAGLANRKYEEKKRKREDIGYSTVSTNTPTKTPPQRPERHHNESQISEEPYSTITTEETQTRISSALPESRRPVTTTILSTSESEPLTPRAVHHRDSYDSQSYLDDSRVSASQRGEKSPNILNKILTVVGMSHFAKKKTDKRDQKTHKHEQMSEKHTEVEKAANVTKGSSIKKPQEYSKKDHHYSSTYLSDITSSDDSSATGSKAPNAAIPSSLIPGTSPMIPQSQSAYDHKKIIDMPSMPEDRHGILHQESDSTLSQTETESNIQRRDSSHQKRETDAAKLAAVEEDQREEYNSRISGAPTSATDNPETSISVKVKLHDDKNHVTLRRLTREEAAAEREARKFDRRYRRAESLSSLSGIDTAASQRRYRRNEVEIEKREDSSVHPAPAPSSHISQPSPTFTGSRKPMGSSFSSSKPPAARGGYLTASRLGSPESYGTWSAMSPGNDDNGEAAAERRRRRRLERSQRSGLDSGGITERTAG